MNLKHILRVTRVRKTALVTLFSLFLLILAGGVVRSTGSGMGCPDWPKCFGQFIPPTSVDDLPENYKEVYSEFRNKKNIRFSALLKSFGFSQLANEIMNDESILEERDFSAFNTWIEYINRLIGAFTGLFIVVLFALSIYLWKLDRSYTYLAAGILVLTGFQGWLGSIVVSTNLLPFLVSLHMILAFVIVGLVLLVFVKTNEYEVKTDINETSFGLKILAIVSILMFFIQLNFGIEVRESIDTIASKLNYENRGNWVSMVGEDFLTHRSFSWIVLLTNGVLIILIMKKFKGWNSLQLSAKLLATFLVLEVIVGVILAYFGLPNYLQPIHLVLASLIFSIQLLILIQFFRMKEIRWSLG